MARMEASGTFVQRALFVSVHLPDIDADRVILFLRGAEPKFDQREWFVDNRSIALARFGMTPDGNFREPINISDPSVAANWYKLCATPREVWALYYQLGFDQLAVWRMAHLWDEQA